MNTLEKSTYPTLSLFIVEECGMALCTVQSHGDVQAHCRYICVGDLADVAVCRVIDSVQLRCWQEQQQIPEVNREIGHHYGDGLFTGCMRRAGGACKLLTMDVFGHQHIFDVMKLCMVIAVVNESIIFNHNYASSSYPDDWKRFQSKNKTCPDAIG